MRIASKIFLSTFLVSSLLSAGIAIATYSSIKQRYISDYRSRYSAVSEMVSDTLRQLEATTEAVMFSALEGAKEYLRQFGVTDAEDLKKLRTRLGLSGIEVIRPDGKFLRATEYDPKELKNFYEFCKDYEKVMTGESPYDRTPLIPSLIDERVFKYAVVRTYDGKYLLNAGMDVRFIGKTLTNALKADSNIVSVGLFTPSGLSLGSFRRDNLEKPDRHSRIETRDDAVIPASDSLIFVSRVKATMTHCCECANKQMTARIGDDSFYYLLRTEVSLKSLYESIAMVRRRILFLAFFAIVMAYGLSRFIARKLVAKIELINRKTEEIITAKKADARLALQGNDEIAAMANKFDQMLESIAHFQKEAINNEKQRVILNIASQVAHDIKSPIAAMDSMMSSVASRLQEDQRVMIRSVVNRIKDIANNLIEKNRELIAIQRGETVAEEGNTTNEVVDALLLSSIIDELITEKRNQFRAKIGVEIYGAIDTSSYGLFARVQRVEFKRMLSNLINNGVEAVAEKGRVTISLRATPHGQAEQADQIEIEVRDSGRGIPPEILGRLGERGFSFGKQDGSGLGLFHARQSVERWMGTLQIHSEPGKGTSVRVALPRAPAPPWFITELRFCPCDTVVVLDDDSSIHQIWETRITDAAVGGENVTVVHHSTPEEFRNWVKVHAAERDITYLMDYELLGFNETGLSLIESLKLEQRAIMVSSRYEEAYVMEKCRTMGVRIIPKALAGFVPITIQTVNSRPDAVLIDDDPLVHLNWKHSAHAAGKTLLSFSDVTAFENVMERLARDTPIYVDSSLGQGVRGEVWAETLARRGFTEIYLATGHSPDEFGPMSWIKRIVGKDPPWNAVS